MKRSLIKSALIAVSGLALLALTLSAQSGDVVISTNTTWAAGTYHLSADGQGYTGGATGAPGDVDCAVADHRGLQPTASARQELAG